MSGERFTLDTDILVYGIDARDPKRQVLALDIVRLAAELDCPLALQAIGEFHVAAVRKLKLKAGEARARAELLMTGFESFAYSAHAVRTALAESAAGRFSYGDAVLLASAAEAGCTAMLSEDMKNGARLGSITVLNPFAHEGLSAAARQLLDE